MAAAAAQVHGPVEQDVRELEREAERHRVAGKIIAWMEALGMVTVPRVSIVVRKTYGQAYFNMGGGGYADLIRMKIAEPSEERFWADQVASAAYAFSRQLSDTEHPDRLRALILETMASAAIWSR